MVDLKLGECLEVMAAMEDGSVDAVVADPPYGTGEWTRQGSGLGSLPRARHHRHDWDVWDTAWLDEARRVSRGMVMFFVPGKQLASATAYADATGEPWRLMVWVKPDPMPMFTGQPAYGFEKVIVLRAGEAEGGTDCIVASSPRKGRDPEATGHPHQKPTKVMRWLCGMSPAGATILDPYMGSGSTGVAALQTGRGFIGIEQDPRWFEVAKDRVEAEQYRHPLFDRAPAEQAELMFA